MSEPAKQLLINSDPGCNNAAVTGGDNMGSFRDPIPSTSIMNPAIGPPVLPPRPEMGMQSYGMNPGYSYGGVGSYGMGGYGGGYGMGGMGGYGGGYGMGGMGMGMGMGAMAPYGGYNRFGGDIESSFIQLAEENTRPAFDSIQSLVNAVGGVAMMLESTFFALTSSFRAILGVAENFGRLRSLFAQFWSTFAVFRTLNWLIKKLQVMLGIRTESEFKAWAEAVAATQTGTGTPEQRARGSSWPILLFFGVVAAAPYIVLRMMNGINNTIEKLNDPKTWQKPLRAVAQHDFQATTPQEISFKASQMLTVAPQQLQGNLWNSGWVMASADRQHAGLIPVNYIKVIIPTNQVESTSNETKEKIEPSADDLDKIYEQHM